jgi:predicted acylesterase/phospholipase RssA
MMYLSNISGLSRIHYPESSFMQAIKFDRLFEKDKPFIYHNAWNISKQRLELFSNKPDSYGQLTPASLCACSALPFVEETVEINGDIYCEGALVDTVNFEKLLEDHPDLDEIWVSRIVDSKQVRAPQNIADALANLCMLFAATVGEDDIKLFRYHVKEDNKWHGKIIEMKVSPKIDFHWTHSNLKSGCDAGYEAADDVLKSYTPESAPKKGKSKK